MQIYLDYSATTPPRSESIAAMQDAMAQQWGNPSSLHEWGQRAATLLERARIQVGDLLDAPPESIVFTSGGTEANNLALLGVARGYARPQHLIISSVEHSAISEPARWLESRGWQVTRLPVDRQGRVDPSDLQGAIQPNTVLVSIIYGQSEVGTIQPIQVLGDIARSHGILFHTDAVQVAGRLRVDVRQLPVDLLSLSSHKIYGPQGVGALYVRPGVSLVPLLGGGGQEMGLRSGTQPIPTIAGFGLAAELARQEMDVETPRLMGLRDRLFALLAETPHLIPTGVCGVSLQDCPWQRLPHHVSFGIADLGSGVTGKTIVRQLNLAGIGISAGSACHSGKVSPSPILQAMGYGDRLAKGGIRLTLGHDTTEADIDWTAMVLQQTIHHFSSQLALL